MKKIGPQGGSIERTRTKSKRLQVYKELLNHDNPNQIQYYYSTNRQTNTETQTSLGNRNDEK
jgi:hypothetical protein